MGQEDPKLRAWYATLQAAMRSLERVEREVEAATGMPASWVEALHFLCKDVDGRRRMSELADQSLLSRGGATRLIARMEEAGLVTREIPPEDRRATYAVITDKGREAMRRAEPVKRAAVERYFASAIDDEQAEDLRQLALRVLERVGERCDWIVRDLAADDAQSEAR